MNVCLYVFTFSWDKPNFYVARALFLGHMKIHNPYRKLSFWNEENTKFFFLQSRLSLVRAQILKYNIKLFFFRNFIFNTFVWVFKRFLFLSTFHINLYSFLSLNEDLAKYRKFPTLLYGIVWYGMVLNWTMDTQCHATLLAKNTHPFIIFPPCVNVTMPSSSSMTIWSTI